MSSRGSDFEQSVYGQKYDDAHAKEYYHKHTKDLWRNFGTWTEQQMLKRSLKQAGWPMSILDIPCGNGRFWPTMQHRPEVAILAADYNPAMIDVAYENKQQDGLPHLTSVVASAFNIPLPDNAVENISCLRLFHHIHLLEERKQLLAELHRVTSNTVSISLQVDGNWYAAKRLPELKKNPNIIHRKYIFYRKLIEQEFKDAGFAIIGYADKCKGISAWRCYTLKKIHAPKAWPWHCPKCRQALNPSAENSYYCSQDNLSFKPNKYGILDLSTRSATSS